MGKWNSLHDIGRFWSRASVSSCHIARCDQLPAQATQTSAGPAWPQHTGSASATPANFPAAPR